MAAGRKARVQRRQIREAPAIQEILLAASADFFPAEDVEPDLSTCSDPWRSSTEQVLREVLLPAAREGWIPEGEEEIAAWARGSPLGSVRDRGAGVLRAHPWPPGFPVPSFAEFVSSEKYLGGPDGRPPLSDRQRLAVEESIGPSAWEWFVVPRRINLAVFCWGKGAGKDLLCSELEAYACYCVASMRNPWFHFGIAQGDALDCLNVAQNAEAARENFFERMLFNLRRPCFASLLDEDDFLTNAVTFRKRVPGHAFPVEFLRLRSMHSGAKNVEGRNTFFWVMDEADEFYDATGHDKARAMLANLTTSSRGTQIGLVISYPRSETGIMFELLDQCGNRVNDEGVRGERPDYWGDRAETGEVLPQKCWVPDEIDEAGHPLPGTIWRNPLSGRTSDLPGAIIDRVMYGVWAYDQPLFEARYRCQPKGAEGAWLLYPHLADDAVRADLVPAGIWRPRVSSRTDAETGLVREHAAVEFEGLELRPGAAYFGGLDIGLDDDSAAFCLSHAVPPGERGFLCASCFADRGLRRRKHYGAEPLPADRDGHPLRGEDGSPVFPDLQGWRPEAWRCDECGSIPRPGTDEFWGVCWPSGKRVRVPVQGADGEASEFRDEWLPLVVEDLLVEWRPDPRERRPVDLIDVRERIAQVRGAGRLLKVYADSWQAELMAQELNRGGMSMETVTISQGFWLRTYGVYKTLLMNGLVELLPGCERRTRQLKELVRRPNGVPDHPEFSRGGGKGRKDLTDAEAMSFYLAATMGRRAPATGEGRRGSPEDRRERGEALDREGRKRLNARRSFVRQVLTEAEPVKGRLR